MQYRRRKFPLLHTRFFNSYSEDWIYDAQALIAEMFHIFLPIETPLKNIQYLCSLAKTKKEEMLKNQPKP